MRSRRQRRTPDVATRAMSRRGFLGGAGAVSLVAVSRPGVAAALRQTEGDHLEVDVAVVGNSLTGLVAARHVANEGLDVAVLGRAPEASTTCFMSSHDRLAGLARSLGLAIGRVPDRGAPVDGRSDGSAEIDDPGDLSADGRAAAEIRTAFRKLDRMASEFEVDAPWAAVNAGIRDGRTLGSWIDEAIAGELAHERLHHGFELIFGAPASQVSLLFALAAVAGTGGAAPLFEAAYLPDAYVDGLEDTLRRSVSGSLVEGTVEVLHGDLDRVEARVGGHRVAARRVVAAAPVPGDDPRRSRFVPGSVTTAVCTYSAAPWRHRGLSGRVFGDGAPVHVVTPIADGRTLIATTRDDGGPDDGRRDAVLESLGRWLGRSAASPIGYEEHTGVSGGRVAAPPGALTGLGSDLREPDGAMHHAGPETALAWIGHPEGLVEIGQRVAAETARALSRFGPGV